MRIQQSVAAENPFVNQPAKERAINSYSRFLQRKCSCTGSQDLNGDREECGNKRVLQKIANPGFNRGDSGFAPTIVHEVLSSPGKPLDPVTRGVMEPRFGHDFGRVRVHTDSKAVESTKAVNALAYTVGDSVVFGQGQFQPGSARGRRLLAHELAHVVQQSGVVGTQGSGITLGSAYDLSEQEAERASEMATTDLGGINCLDRLVLRRYSHSDCSEDDLRSTVWPADYVARQMVAKAIRVLTSSPTDARVQSLLTKYFMSASPNVAEILSVFNKIQDVFTKNDYTYECETSCDSGVQAYTRARLRYIGISPNIHLCMNALSGMSPECVAQVIVHELSHYAAHTDDEADCGSNCSPGNCPTSLSQDDALDNSYSYDGFAFELYSLAI